MCYVFDIYVLFSFRYMFLAGEHCDQETLHWIRDRFQVPCLDHWWQTGKQNSVLLLKTLLINVGVNLGINSVPNYAAKLCVAFVARIMFLAVMLLLVKN